MWRRVALCCVAVTAAPLAGVPVPSIEKAWAIGVYSGSHPLQLHPDPEIANPALSASDVTDIPAAFVADPFVLRDGSRWYLFFEVFNRDTRRGEIAWAESSDLIRWRYGSVALREPFHLSYPYVFEHEGQRYLVPESVGARQVRLYKATAFPARWEFAGTLIDGVALSDPSLAFVDGRWWMFGGGVNNQTLLAYYAPQLFGPWRPHSRNPLVTAVDEARPGGRVMHIDRRLVRFAQVTRPSYGRAVRAFTITSLTPDAFAEAPVGDDTVIGATGRGWNADGMHQVDAVQVGPDRWIALVDGYRRTIMFGMRRWSWRQLSWTTGD